MTRNLTRKLEKLLRHHRQNVFCETSGDAHARALVRLKKTATFRAMCRANECAANQRLNERMTGMGY